MDVRAVSDNSVLEIYGKAVTQEVESRQKLAKIAIERKMEQEKMEMALDALSQFYA